MPAMLACIRVQSDTRNYATRIRARGTKNLQPGNLRRPWDIFIFSNPNAMAIRAHFSVRSYEPLDRDNELSRSPVRYIRQE